MTFNPAKPANDEKIRNLGEVIRPNWDAIQQASTSFQPYAINFVERNTIGGGVTNDPTAIANAYLLYSKQDTAGDPELFGINQNGDIAQLTNGTVLSATAGHTFLPGEMLMQWNTVTVASGSNVTYPVAFSAVPYYVNFIPITTGAPNRLYHRISGNPTATTFSPIILDKDGVGQTKQINYVAIGPKA